MKERFTLRPKEHSVLVKQTSKWGQAIAISLISLGSIILTTSYLYKIDEIITAPGILTPAEGGVEIKSPISGNLQEIKVKEGDIIEKGDIVLIFDMRKQLEEKRRLSTEIELMKQNMNEELNSNALKIENKESSLKVTKNILDRIKPLEKVGALSEVRILQQEEKIKSMENEILQIKSERNNLRTRSEAKIKESESKLKQVKLILEQSNVKSPIDGEVFNIKPDNNAYVSTQAEKLLEVVPKDGLSASLKVTNKDIGFMKIGQKVKVRVNSYPFTEYGELNGKIKNIGADALEPTQTMREYHFPVTIKLKDDKLKTKSGGIIPLQAGMTINANIKLRERRLIEMVSDMFVSQKESLERLRKP